VTPWYGIDILVDAVAIARASVPNIRLDIYGEGDAVTALRTRAAGVSVGDVVTFHEGHIPHRDVLACVRGASVGVIPNRPSELNRYALSSKLFEYVELEIPVVSAGLPTVREHFSDDEIRFFEPGSATALAAALVDTASDPAAAMARAASARRRARAYSWDENASRYLHVLERALRRPA
jgi:glycosyltransferase involved in cell wall biosynthesis